MKRGALTSLLILLAIAAASIVLAVVCGSVTLDWSALLRDSDPTTRIILLELRLPRALSAFAIGALLALSGALMQILLRNPLADPYVLGLSGGAAVAALGALMLGAAGLIVSGAALGGALFSVFLVFTLARGDYSFTHARLLLTGVVVAAGWGAAISLLLVLAPDARLRGMLFWLMGDLGTAGFPWLALSTLVAMLALCLPWGGSLNILAQGDLTARALGVPVAQLRRLLYFAASACAAVAVTSAGTIGFVGLLAPHMARMALGNDQRLLLPGAALMGGALLTLADTAARTVIAPAQLPVGALTAALGVPLFLYLMARR